jgi:hypothetical protein
MLAVMRVVLLVDMTVGTKVSPRAEQKVDSTAV